MRRVTGIYRFFDASGNLAYWKERIEPGRNGERKEFCFYHGNKEKGRGGSSLLYNLPDVIKSKAVIITEGEKQADIIKSLGLCGTSLDSGAGSKLPVEMATILTGKRIAMLQDNDEPGRMYAEKLAEATSGICENFRIVMLPDLPEKGDICDWNGDKKQLVEIIRKTPIWKAAQKAKKDIVKREYKKKEGITDISEQIAQAETYPIDKLIEIVGNKTRCIAHKEKTPSMVYYPERNKVHCYGCGWRGGAIDVLMIRDGVNFKTAVSQLSGE